MSVPSLYMSLPVPSVGTTDGPQYAIDINSCMSVIDAHDHTPGNGVQITPSGLDINAELTVNNNDITAIKSARFQIQGSPLSGPSDLGCLYESGVDLYFNDGNGNQIQITSGGGIAGTPGSISGLVSPASASYSAVSGKFVWQSAALTAANMDFGSAIMRNGSASSFGLTLSPPTLGSNYSLVLPPLPVSQKFMTLDASGNMSAPWAVDNSSLEIASSTTLQVKAGGITAAMLSSGIMTILAITTYSSGSGTHTTNSEASGVLIFGRGGSGGGGGGGADTIGGFGAGGGGGGGGAASFSVYKTVSPSTGYAYSIGQGGAGGAGGTFNNNNAATGSNGTSTTLGSLVAFPGVGGGVGGSWGSLASNNLGGAGRSGLFISGAGGTGGTGSLGGGGGGNGSSGGLSLTSPSVASGGTGDAIAGGGAGGGGGTGDGVGATGANGNVLTVPTTATSGGGGGGGSGSGDGTGGPGGTGGAGSDGYLTIIEFG